MSNSVSVVIATWNRINELKKCIESVLSQDYYINELIVIDNRSTDGTYIYCNEIVYDHCINNGIDFIYKTVNCSALEALNIGYLWSVSPFIVTVDDDAELLRKDTIRLLVKGLVENDDVWIVGCNVVPDKSVYSDDLNYVDVHWVMGSAFCMRNSIHSRFDKSLKIYGNELDLSVRMLIAGYKTILIDGLFVYHPFRVETFSDSREKIRIVNAFDVLKYFNIKYKIKMIIVYIIGCTWELYALFSWKMMAWWIFKIPRMIIKTFIKSCDKVNVDFQREYYLERRKRIIDYLKNKLN